MRPSSVGLTEEQKIAVEIFDAPIAMTAGAGSGKTRVLVERFLALTRRGVDPRRILTVTFTNEAAEELRTRIRQDLMGREAKPEIIESIENSPWIGTIHSFCYRVFEQFGSLLKQPKIQTITDDFELVALFARHYEEWLASVPDSTFQGLTNYFSANDVYEIAELMFLNQFHFHTTSQLLKDDQDLGNKMIRRLKDLLSPLVATLRGELHAKGSYTFNDLETFSYRLLHEYSHVAAYLQKQFDYLLIDEFQDTSRLQWSILKPLIGKEWKKLFIVGDPKQSIYGFRHAEVALFKEVMQEIEERSGVLQSLSVNYRTQSKLLDHVNTASSKLFEMATVPFHAMRAGREEAGSTIDLRFYSSTPELSRKDWQDLERDSIVESVVSMVNSGVAQPSIALLFRNSDRMKAYSDALEHKGLKTYTEISASLFEMYEMLDLVHFLEAVEDPLNEFALSAFLFSPYISLPTEIYYGLTQTKNRDQVSLYEALRKTPDPRYDWFLNFLESGDPTVIRALETLFRSTQRFPSFYEGLLTLLRPLLTLSSLPDVVEALRLWKKKGVIVHRTLGSKETGIRLMTVHGAKGLEFSHVYLADCLRQPPHRQPPLLLAPGHPAALKFRTEEGFGFSESYETLWAHLRGQEDEEAKRILYVALTRARESLTVFLPKGMKTIPKGSWASLLENALTTETTS